MQKEHSFKLLSSYNLVLESYHGLVSADSYQELKSKEMRTPEYHPHFNHLCDFRFSTINFSQQYLEKTISYILKNPQVNAMRKSVILVADPFTEAKLLLFKRASQKSNIDVKICHRLSDALDYLKTSAPLEFIQEQLEVLRKD